MSLTADMVLAPASNASCRPSRYVSSRSFSFDCLCAVGGANVACNVFVTVGDTLLLLHVLHEYVDAHLPGGGEEVPGCQNALSSACRISGFSSRILRDVTPLSELMNLVRSVVGFAVKRM